MRWSKLNFFLFALNLGLLAFLIFYFKVRTDGSRPAGTEAVGDIQTSVVVKSAPPQIITVTNHVQWAQLESEDYKTYIARLRSIGCPEQTIRDIIIADLDKLLAPRVQAIYGRRAELKYWHPEEEERANNFDQREWTGKEKQIDREKRAIIKELVGTDLLRERMKQKGQEDYYERRLGFLPESKRDQVRSLLEKFDEQEQKIRAKEDDGELLNAGDREQLRVLRQQREAELAATLAPAEREQMELWISPTANAVRHSLYGMEATEQEFLAVYKARKDFDEQWGQRDVELMDNASRERWEQSKAGTEAKIKAELGEKRYTDFKRGEDEDFHLLNMTLSRFKLPREKAVEVYEYKKVVQGIRNQVLADPALPPAQRETALKAIAQETEREVKAALGEKAFNFYVRRAEGSWVRP